MIDTTKYEGHTPGPWAKAPKESRSEIIAESNDTNGGYVIAETCGPDKEANAKLISDAPIILEALKAAQERIAELKVQKHIHENCAASCPYVVKSKPREYTDDELMEMAR